MASSCLSYATVIDHLLLNLQYNKTVKPSFDEFILPTKKYADIIIPRGGDNHVAVDLIVQHIQTKLGQHDLCKIYPNIFVINSTFQVITLPSYYLLDNFEFCLTCFKINEFFGMRLIIYTIHVRCFLF